MFTSVCELFKLGIGPSSSHTNGPMIAANWFMQDIKQLDIPQNSVLRLECVLSGSLAYTGKGHGTDTAVALGLHGYAPEDVARLSAGPDYESLINELIQCECIALSDENKIRFDVARDLLFDLKKNHAEHPNGLTFNLYQDRPEGKAQLLLSGTFFSIGGGFVKRKEECHSSSGSNDVDKRAFAFKHGFDSAQEALRLADSEGLSFADIQCANELYRVDKETLDADLASIREAMFSCVERGLDCEGILPGGLGVGRRAKKLYEDLLDNSEASLNEWLCAYAMAVNEENAAGHAVVTAPTNGAAGVIPSVLYYLSKHRNISAEQEKRYLLTATLIGGLIKHGSSISGAEVGCQGEIGSASAMAAAGCCAVLGGSPQQVENAAEIALEHHLGMTCDPVGGLVQIPCIERNGFGAIKAYAAATLALHGDGRHFISLDSCIAAMKETGDEMSVKFKETSQGGLAVKWVDC